MKEGEYNIVSYFLNAAGEYPDKIAISHSSREITFNSLHQEVLYTAAYFQKMGIRKGDRILVFVPMGIDLYRILLAIFYIGASAVFLDAWVNRKRMDVCLDIADCKAIIGSWKVRGLNLISGPIRRIPIFLSVKGRLLEKPEMQMVNEEETALITFTTGSTGRPKAAERSHRFLNEQFKALTLEINPKPEDVDMPLLPIVLLINLGIGSTSIIADVDFKKLHDFNPQKVISQIQHKKVSRLIASPHFIVKLAEFIRSNNIEVEGIRKIFTGGAPVFPHEAKIISQAFPKSESNVVYGSTEAEPMASVSCKDLASFRIEEHKGLLVGKIFEKARIRIIMIKDENISVETNSLLDSLTLEEGEIGEIIVSGPHVLDRYYRNEEAFMRNKIISEGVLWHRTGDSGYISNGSLYLTGRCAQLIERNGKIISPFVIEERLKNIEGIELGCLLENEGKLILAIQKEPDIEPNLNDFQAMGDEIQFVKKIPLDPRHHSKIDYEALKKMIF